MDTGSFLSAPLNIPLGINGTAEARAPSCSASQVNCLASLLSFLSQSYVNKRVYSLQ